MRLRHRLGAVAGTTGRDCVICEPSLKGWPERRSVRPGSGEWGGGGC